MTTIGLRVSILTMNYAPEVTGIAPYATGLARGLAADGCDVRVITSYPHYPAWRFDPNYKGRTMDETMDGVQVRRRKPFMPKRMSNRGRIIFEASFGGLAALESLRDTDVLVCVTPPLVSTAVLLARLRMSKRSPAIGMWVQDLYSRGLQETGASSRVVEAATAIESRILQHADGVAVIHDRFASYVADSLAVDHDRISVIRNWTHIKSGPVCASSETRARYGWADDETIVLHAGNMGVKQGLETVVEAARLVDESAKNIRFVLLGDGNQRKRLESLGQGVSSLQFIDPLGDYEFRSVLAAADVLLVNELSGVTEMAVPSKLTSYFSVGKPVLAATEADSVTAGEVMAAGAGIRVPSGRADAIVSGVEDILADSVQRLGFGRAARDYCATTLSEANSISAFSDWVRVLAKGS